MCDKLSPPATPPELMGLMVFSAVGRLISCTSRCAIRAACAANSSKSRRSSTAHTMRSRAVLLGRAITAWYRAVQPTVSSARTSYPVCASRFFRASSCAVCSSRSAAAAAAASPLSSSIPINPVSPLLSSSPPLVASPSSSSFSVSISVSSSSSSSSSSWSASPTPSLSSSSSPPSPSSSWSALCSAHAAAPKSTSSYPDEMSSRGAAASCLGCSCPSVPLLLLLLLLSSIGTRVCFFLPFLSQQHQVSRSV